MIPEKKYSDFVGELFEKIESKLSDLALLIQTAENPNQKNRLLQFYMECEGEYKDLKSIDFSKLEGDDPDTCYQCSNITTDIYDLIKKLKNNGTY